MISEAAKIMISEEILNDLRFLVQHSTHKRRMKPFLKTMTDYLRLVELLRLLISEKSWKNRKILRSNYTTGGVDNIPRHSAEQMFVLDGGKKISRARAHKLQSQMQRVTNPSFISSKEQRVQGGRALNLGDHFDSNISRGKFWVYKKSDSKESTFHFGHI